MEIKIVDPQDYRRMFGRPVIAFDSVDFNALNAAKVCRVLHMVWDDGGKVRFGLIAGIDAEGRLRAPFSAPFASIEAVGRQRVEHYVAAAQALSAWLHAAGRTARITLPPHCYGQPVAMQTAALLAAPGARLAWADYNYHFDLTDLAGMRAAMDSKVRNKLTVAERQGYDFETRTPLPEAHAVIVANHDAKGYPTHLSADDLAATARTVKIDTFGLRKDGVLVAAAIVYRTAPDVAQVIYWGDRPDARAGHPMHLLAFRVFEHYGSRGLRVCDPGPASSQGVASAGLCDFKAGLGCRLTLKPTIIIE